jgi:hypothetical protein
MDTFCLPEISRRAFMAVVAGGLLAGPLGAEAQPPRGKSARIGLLATSLHS